MSSIKKTSNSFLKNYFGFNKQQRNGLYVLMLISFLLLVARLVYPYFISPGNVIMANLPLVEHKLDSSDAARPVIQSSNYDKGSMPALFAFDPNTVSFEQLLALGFKEKNAKILLKFRAKGFVFHQKSDLKKVYGVSDYLYTKLEPYIAIVAQNTASTKASTHKAAKEENPERAPAETQKATPLVDLNTADSLGLVALSGIGPVFAKRIIKYRNILGGYASVDQLKEVYGFTEEVFENTKRFFTANVNAVNKININTAEFKIIGRHPYLGYALAKSICNQRRKAPLTSADLEVLMSDPALYRKLLPYLSF